MNWKDETWKKSLIFGNKISRAGARRSQERRARALLR